MSQLVSEKGDNNRWSRSQESNGSSFPDENLTISADILVDQEAHLISSGNIKGLSLISAATFIVGEMAGSGILALPSAVAGIGWPGLAVIAICCLASGYAAVYLGKSWTMVETRWPEYREGCREPFSVIGQKAYGSKMKHFVAVNILVQLFGVVVVFLLLAAELVYDLLSSQVTQVTLCDWIIILALLMLPFTWFGSPMDIPLIAYAAMSCTAVSCVLLVILFFQESTELAKVDHGNITLKSAFLSLGTILFAFGGAATFPTFQNDMKNKSNFPWAVAIGFGLMLVLYLPVAGGGYAIYGSKVSSNIVDDVQPGGLTTAIDVLMAFHVLCAFLIVINVVNLSFEHYLGLKHEFNLKRCSFRSFVLLIVIFIGLTVPKFGKILNLVGGSTVSLTSFIMPPIFYMKLADQYCDDWPESKVSLKSRIVLWSVAILGIIGGCTATYSAVSDVIGPDTFTRPCYIK